MPLICCTFPGTSSSPIPALVAWTTIAPKATVRLKQVLSAPAHLDQPPVARCHRVHISPAISQSTRSSPGVFLSHVRDLQLATISPSPAMHPTCSASAAASTSSPAGFIRSTRWGMETKKTKSCNKICGQIFKGSCPFSWFYVHAWSALRRVILLQIERRQRASRRQAF